MADNGWRNGTGNTLSWTAGWGYPSLVLVMLDAPSGWPDGTLVRSVSTRAQYNGDFYIWEYEAPNYYLSTDAGGSNTVGYSGSGTGTVLDLTNIGHICWQQDDTLAMSIDDTAGDCYMIQEDGSFKIKDSSNNTVMQIWETI